MRRQSRSWLVSSTLAGVFVLLSPAVWAQQGDEIEDGDLEGAEQEAPPPEMEPQQQAPGMVQAPNVGQPAPVNDAAGDFYQALDPYGRWVSSDDVAGGWVWVPHRHVVGAGFQPYVTAGRWQNTDRGWMFVSDYSWGWAPFHYGRWYQHPAYGWAWVPGNQWAPAWVDWRTGSDGVVGWAPLPPAGYAAAAAWWVFAPGNLLIRPRISSYLLPRHRWGYHYGRTRHYRRNRGWAWRGGPEPRHIGLRMGARIHVAPPSSGVVASVSFNGGRAVWHRRGYARRVVAPVRYRGPRRRAYAPGYRRPAPAAGRRYREAPPASSGYRRPAPGYRRPAPGYRRPASVAGRRYREAPPAAPAYRRPAPRSAPGYRGAPPSRGRRGSGHADDEENNRRRRNQGSANNQRRRAAPASNSGGGRGGRRGGGGRRR